MTSSPWVTAGISATVAAVTTLVVEYFAKPWLEVRKDRILEHSRNRREALRALQHLCFIAGRIDALRTEQDIELMRNRTVELAAQLEPGIYGALEFLDPPSSLEQAWTTYSGVTAACAEWLKQEEPPARVWDDVTLATDALEHFVRLFELPRFRWLRRRHIVKSIRALPPITSRGQRRTA